MHLYKILDRKTIKALKVKSEEAFIEEMKEKYNSGR